MHELRFQAEGLTERRYRRWKRLARPSGLASGILTLATVILGFYLIRVTIDTVLVTFVETPISKVLLTGAFAESANPESGRFHLSISPLDRDGKLISVGLSLENFEFTPVSITDMADSSQVVAGSVVPVGMNIFGPSNAEQGAKILMLFDSSGSMKDNDPDKNRVKAGKRFVKHLASGEELVSGLQMAIMDFDELHQDFTANVDDLNKAIEGVGATGGTPLFQKIKEAIDHFENCELCDQTVLVFNDGESDNRDSNETNQHFQEAIERARKSNTRILSVGLGESVDFSDLEIMANRSRGTFVRVDNAKQLETFFDAIATSVSEGRILVIGQASFDRPLALDRSYEVSGNLLTKTAGSVGTTSFRFVMRTGS